MSRDTVAIYCRLSSEDSDKLNKGDDSESIQNQKLLLADYAARQGWQIFRIYVDEDCSGLDRDRPQFNRMIADARDGLFRIILCKTQSRFTRDMELVEKYINGLFILWGVRFVSLVDNIDTSLKGNKKARQIYGLINEWYSEDLSDNIRAVFKRKMEEGQYLGPFAPYGYKKDPCDRHRIIVDEEAASVVREIYRLYLDGNGYYAIARILTERGVLTPTLYKKSKGLNFENPNFEKYGVWAANSIRRILTNRIYIGCLIQGRERKLSYKSKKVVIAPKDEWVVIENNHEPIIEVAAFDTVQKKMPGNQPEKKIKSKSPNHSNILDGKIKCINCGSGMQKGSPTRDGTSVYLRCALAHKTKYVKCATQSVRLDSLTSAVEDKIRGFITDFLASDSNTARLKKALPSYRDSLSEFNITRETVCEFVESVQIGGRNESGEREIIINWLI